MTFLITALKAVFKEDLPPPSLPDYPHPVQDDRVLQYYLLPPPANDWVTAVALKNLLEIAQYQNEGGETLHNPDRWTWENFDEAQGLLNKISESDENYPTLQGLIGLYWAPRNAIRELIAKSDWTNEDLEKAKNIVKTFTKGIIDRDNQKLEQLKTLVAERGARDASVALTLLPLNLKNVDHFCKSVGNELTGAQKAQAAYFINAYVQKPTSEMASAIEVLQAMMLTPEKSAREYTTEIVTVLDLLKEGGNYELTKLDDPKCFEPAIRLLKELQGKNFQDDRYIRYKDRLEQLIGLYVEGTFTDSNDETQVKKAIALLSFSRQIPAAVPVPFEEALVTFINAYADAQLKLCPKNPQELPNAPVGINNEDKTSCFACAFMQLVANNKLLRDAYTSVADSPNLEKVRNFLIGYLQIQLSPKPADPKKCDGVKNIGTVGGTLPRPGQQDISELMTLLNSEFPIDNKGQVGKKNPVTLGAKIVYDMDNFQTSVQKTGIPIDSDRPYIFPSMDLSFDPDEPHPSLSGLEKIPSIAVDDENTPISETRYYFAEVPNIVVYQLNRLVVEVDPQTHLETKRYVNRTEVDMPLHHPVADGLGLMQLQGFIRHSGNAEGGHYVSYLAQGGKFWLINDDKVYEIQAADFLIAARHARTALYSTVQRF